jgi:RNase P subunit RPR2
MPSSDKLAQFFGLPDLKVYTIKKDQIASNVVYASKTSLHEVCPKCAKPSSVVYDHRIVRLRDAPLRGQSIKLSVKKRRFFCKPCKKPFTEPIPGVMKGKRTTQRYRTAVLWACENFSDLSRVRKAMRCSSGFIYQTLFEQIKGKLGEKLNYPWPSTIGVDEHFFTRRRGRAHQPLTNGVLRSPVIKDRCRYEDYFYGVGTKCFITNAMPSIDGSKNIPSFKKFTPPKKRSTAFTESKDPSVPLWL